MEITENTECFPWTPKSICLPKDVTITIMNQCYFQGKSAEITETVACLETIEYALLSKYGIKLSGFRNGFSKTHLKRNSNSNTNTETLTKI